MAGSRKGLLNWERGVNSSCPWAYLSSFGRMMNPTSCASCYKTAIEASTHP